MIRLLVTSGRGPTECRIALAKMLPVMEREAEAAGLGFDVAAAQGPDNHGPGSAMLAIHGEGATVFAQSWMGAVLWIANSPVRPQHKRKNWYVGVFELPPGEGAPVSLAPADIRFEAFRAGGPGGQHQNKTESAIRAIHLPTGLAVVARSHRSQHRNKAEAVERLGQVLRYERELAAMAAQADAHVSHDRLERGRPVRRFKGMEFRPA
jgi:peptide chain release factor